MNSTKIAGMAMMAVMMITSACNKYEEGPGVSLRSRKERIANDWKVASAMNGSEDVTDDFEQYEVSLSKSGGATLNATYTFLGATYEYSTTGTWVFEDKDEKVNVNYENDEADATYLILKLEEEELWVREEGTDLELHLVPR